MREYLKIYIDGRWFAVIGIMRPLPLAPELNPQALIGLPVTDRDETLRRLDRYAPLLG